MAEDSSVVVYHLGPTCGVEDVEEGKIYRVRVQGFANFGTFVQFNDRVKGLIHKSNIKTRHQERDTVLVKVLTIRSNGNIDLEEVVLTDYQVETVTRKSTAVKLSDVGKKIGKTVYIEGEVAQIKQTSGPTIFTLVDGYGTINAAAFVEAGVRAFPEVELGQGVAIVGEVMQRNNQLQVEVGSLTPLSGEDAEKLTSHISQALDKKAEPPEIPFLVKSEILDQLKPEMRKLAKVIRRAVFEAQPVLIRHHADADGICAAVAIEQALISLIKENGGDFDADYFLVKRAPSKAPFYETEDITRDLDFALKDNVRYGQKMPLILLADNGSTEEDEPSMKIAQVYDLSVVVMDHHHPDAVIDRYLRAHVNPYHVGGDFGITSGMLGTEVARLVNPSVEPLIRHLPAVSAVADRSEAPERQRYLELVRDRYSEDECKEIALSLDFEQFWLRFNDGRELVKDILDLNGNSVRHKQLVRLLAEQANLAIENQLEATMPHIREQTLPNGARLFLLDVEIHAHKFTFPPPGKTSGEVHDQLVKRYASDPIVTIGFGPDFAVLRSKGVLMNIPHMVRELRTEIAGGGVSGGGHLVVGSIKFVEGMRDQVLEGLIQKIGAAEISQ
jgi:archaea-specific RecJ-like exonuclease